jgi:hypothetical protein
MVSTVEHIRFTLMAWLNGILLKQCSSCQPLSWFRLIDDVDMKWIHSDKELDEFFEHANSIHPSIKYTHEVSKAKISFLDTTTTAKDRQK